MIDWQYIFDRLVYLSGFIAAMGMLIKQVFHFKPGKHCNMNFEKYDKKIDHNTKEIEITKKEIKKLGSKTDKVFTQVQDLSGTLKANVDKLNGVVNRIEAITNLLMSHAIKTGVFEDNKSFFMPEDKPREK